MKSDHEQENQSSSSSAGLRTGLLMIVRGCVMGVSEVLPGISGGTVALLLGIYDRMVMALADITLVVKDLVRFKRPSLSQIWQPLVVLIPLGVGMLIGAMATVFTIKQLLETHSVLVFAFIFGVVVAAAGMTFIESKLWARVAFLPVGLLISLALGLFTHSESEPHISLVYVGGFLAFGAWILPGISGSLVLLILGVWAAMIHAITAFDYFKMGVFATGLITGWLVFSHPVRVMLGKYRQQLMALFSGLLLGSLLHIWPWQVNNQPRLPFKLEGDPSVLAVGLMMLVGFSLVWGLTYVRTQQQTR